MLKIRVPAKEFKSSIQKVRKSAQSSIADTKNITFPSIPQLSNICKVRKVTFVIPKLIKTKSQKAVYIAWKNDVPTMKASNKNIEFELKRVSEVLPSNYAKCLIEYVDSSVSVLRIGSDKIFNSITSKHNIDSQSLLSDRIVNAMLLDSESKQIDLNYYNYLQYRKNHQL